MSLVNGFGCLVFKKESCFLDMKQIDNERRGERLSLLLNSLSRALKSGRVCEATSKPELYRRTSLGLVLCIELVYIHQG